MRTRVFLIVLGCVFLLGVPVYAQFQANLPQIANGFLIQTTFIFFNNGDDTAEVTLALRDDNGDPFVLDLAGLGVGSTHQFTLEPGQTRFFQSDGLGENRAGAARVTSTADIGVSAIFSLLGTPPVTGVRTEAGVGSSPMLADFVIAVDTTGGFNTGLAVQNLTNSPNEITFAVPGAGVASQQADRRSPAQVSRTLPANGHLAIFVSGRDQLFPSLTDFQGRMIVSPSAPVAAVTLRQATSGVPLTTLPVVSTASLQTAFNLPQIADGDTIKTQFVIFGLAGAEPTGAQSGNAELTLTDDDGNPFPVNLSNGMSGSTFSLPLESDGALFFETEGSGPPVAGAATVVSDFPIGVSAIFTVDLPGRPTTEAGVGDSRALDRFTFPADLRSPFDTGLALFNRNDETASVELTFFNQDGGVVEESAVVIAPFSVRQITPAVSLEPMGPLTHRSQFVGQLLPGLDLTGRQGQVAVVSTHSLSALSLRQSPTTLTTLPVGPGVTDAASEPVTPGGSELLPVTVENVDLTVSATLDQQLPGGRRISGNLDSPDPVTRVWALRRSDGMIFNGASNFDRYAINVPEGSYNIHTCASIGFGTFLPSFGYVGNIVENVTVDANVIRNITVPFPNTRNVTGDVTNLEELPPLPSGSIVFLIFQDEESLYLGLALIPTPVTNYQVRLPDGDYRVSLGAVLGEDRDADNVPDTLEEAIFLLGIGELAVSGLDLSAANFAVPSLSDLSGTVSVLNDPVIPDGTLVSAFDRSAPGAAFAEQCLPPFGGGLAAVAPDGNYATVLLPGRDYSLTAILPVTGIGTEEEGLWSSFAQGGNPVPIGGDMVVNFEYPEQPAVVAVSGIVTDPSSVPLRDVEVLISAMDGIASSPDTGYTVRTMTAADGTYTAQVLSGSNYSITFDPGPPALAPPQAPGAIK